MKTNLFIVGLIIFAPLLTAQTNDMVDAGHLTLIWKTDTVFDTPESVCFDKENQVLYVSNVGGNQPWTKDGFGYISKLGLDGKIVEKQWVKGLQAPKGMGIYNGFLYVADIDVVVKINIASSTIVKHIEIISAVALNDIEIGNNGIIYISDSEAKTVYKIENDTPTIYHLNPIHQRPNGLYKSSHGLLLATGTNIVKVLEDDKADVLLESTGGVDGIGQINNKVFIYSHWPGKVFVHKMGDVQKLILEYPENNKNSADIVYIPEKQWLLIPTFFANTVECYKVKY